MPNRIPPVNGRYLLPPNVCINEDDYSLYRCNEDEILDNNKANEEIDKCVFKDDCMFSVDDENRLTIYLLPVNIYPGSLYAKAGRRQDVGDIEYFAKNIRTKFAAIMSKYNLKQKIIQKDANPPQKVTNAKPKVVKPLDSQAKPKDKSTSKKNTKTSSVKMTKKTKSKYFKPQHGCRLKHPSCRGHIIGKRQLNLSRVLRMSTKRVNKFLSCNAMRM